MRGQGMCHPSLDVSVEQIIAQLRGVRAHVGKEGPGKDHGEGKEASERRQKLAKRKLPSKSMFHYAHFGFVRLLSEESHDLRVPIGADRNGTFTLGGIVSGL